MSLQEATKIVMSRIQNLDPENATKIMGYILLQDNGEKEMLRLAFAADTLLLSYIKQATTRLGLTQNNPSPRITIPNSGFHFAKPSSPFSRSSPSHQPQPISYASVFNGVSQSGQDSNFSGPASPSLQFYAGNEFKGEFLGQNSFGVSSEHEPCFGDTVAPPHSMHWRGCSVNDAAFLSGFEEDFGFGFNRPDCMYFGRESSRNGSDFQFSHSSDLSEGIVAGFDDSLRANALQQRLALMGFEGHRDKCMSFLEGNHRNDFSATGLGGASSSCARQIYLTFPADSMFEEEDVFNYFSMFGPVQDVRIPYQQKRMFAFVAFLYPKTVKLILAKGNPHFICDSRVLVKPYKEKGKLLEKKQLQHRQQHLEKEGYSGCLSPSRFDSKELFELPVGPRMRRKFEQETELQEAIELQARKMMNIHLMDSNKQHGCNLQLPHCLPNCIPGSSPGQSPLPMNHNTIASSNTSGEEGLRGCLLASEFEGEDTLKPSVVQAYEIKSPLKEIESSINSHIYGGDEQLGNNEESCLLESSPPAWSSLLHVTSK